MGDYERRLPEFASLEPPDEVAIDEDHWLHLSPLSSHATDIRHLPRPLTAIGEEPEDSIFPHERKLRDEYIAMCEATYAALWHETERYIATTSIDNDAPLDDSAVFDTHLAFDELVQNAFRYGGRPQRLWVSVVRASDSFSFVPRQPSQEGSSVQLRTPQAALASGNRILLGVQDTSPDWKEQERVADGDLPVHLRGLDIIRGISKAVWYQSNETDSKWVWTLI